MARAAALAARARVLQRAARARLARRALSRLGAPRRSDPSLPLLLPLPMSLLYTPSPHAAPTPIPLLLLPLPMSLLDIPSPHAAPTARACAPPRAFPGAGA